MAKKISDISPYFKQEGEGWIFTGKKLEVYIPTVYQDKGLLVLGETANTLGICQLVINDQFEADFLLLSKIVIEFTNQREEKKDDYPYIVLELINGQAFIKNRKLVKDSDLVYQVFMMMLAYGKVPPFLNYNSIQSLFDNDRRACGIDLGVNRCIWEMIYAHMHRDEKDPYQYYRLTPMTKQPVIVPLHAISHSPRSTTAKIVGSYMTDGMVSGLVDEPDEPSTVENLLRS